MMDSLKRFYFHSTTSKVVQQNEMLQDINNYLLTKPDLPQATLHACVYSLSCTLGLYYDSNARRKCVELIQLLVTNYPKVSISLLTTVLEEVAKFQLSNKRPSRSESAKALVTLTWSCALAKQCIVEELKNAVDWDKFIQLQAALFYGAQASQKKSICSSSQKSLKNLWTQVPELFKIYADTLTSKKNASASDCTLLAALVFHDKSLFVSKKSEILNIFVASVVMSKVAVAPHTLACCISFILEINHSDFEKTLFPALQKSLLRSPENCLPIILVIMKNVSIDLSRHSLSLMKMLGPQLTSKNDANRDIACDVVTALASQCSDAEAVGDAVKHLFAILKGSEGKLTLATQKCAVLNAVGGFGESPTGSGQFSLSLVSSVVVLFLPFLQQEVHDVTLVAAVSALTKWCMKLRSDIPKELLDWFAKAPSLKTSTPVVRAAYLDCMAAVFKSDNVEKIEPFIPHLLQSVEKANRQQSQIPLVTEALHASFLLSKIDKIVFKKDYKFAGFWTTVLDSQNLIFTSERFLQNASEDALRKLQEFICCLMLDHPQKMQEDLTKSYYKALVYILLNKPWKLQRNVKKSIKKLLASFSGMQSCTALLAELHAAFDSDSLGFGSSEDEIESLKISRIYCDALLSVLVLPTFKTDKNSVRDVAMKILIDSHRPCITLANSKFFLRFLLRYHVDPYQFISNRLAEITHTLIYVDTCSKAQLAALTTITEVAADIVLPVITTQVMKVFTSASLGRITKREFEIMKTAEGDLWNIDVIKSAPTIAENKKMKRENKAYSFKDQLMEEELRLELEQKKQQKDGGGVKGSGGSDFAASRIPQNLTKKQKELVDQELKSEAVLRANLQKIDNEFETSCQILSAAMSINDYGECLPSNVLPLMKPLLSLCSSAMACHRAQDLYIALGTGIMPPHLRSLGKQVAYVTLRLYKPIMEVDENWCFESLSENSHRILEMLSNAFGQNSQCAVVFCYIFPFLRKLLRDSMSLGDAADVDLMRSAIKLILVHVRKEAASDILPRAALLECMCELITTSLVEVQHLASDVLQATCQAAYNFTGDEIFDEIEILLQALLSPSNEVRTAASKGLLVIHARIKSLSEEKRDQLHVIRRVWVAMHDEDDVNKALGESLWIKLLYHTTGSICLDLLEDVQRSDEGIQQAAASSLNEALQLHEDQVPLVLEALFYLYNEKKERPPPVLDELGRIIVESPPDEYQTRIGIALALKALSPVLPETEVTSLFSFFVPDGLSDRSSKVGQKMLDAALQVVNDHGKQSTGALLKVFEGFLRDAPTSKQYDQVRQKVVILLGTLARHLDKNDPKVKPIVAKLTETLSTPSQPVQEAVANCLPALVPSIKADAPNIVKKLLAILLRSERYGERRGAAYGLAGMVKGLGIISFKQLDIMTTLSEAVQDKKNSRRREGALMAFEMFCKMLGRLFEPYVVHVLPHLLLCFGDNSEFIRKAANDTAKAVMLNLSAHGVRLVLPSLLNALQSEDSWRTKTGAAELLGAMAFCAPKQLSACLPSIVPKLCEVLTDSHPKVQKAGEQALKHIGSVIRNPEIQAISVQLLSALSNPSQKTSKCLETLLNTKFVHFIDAPSLALILPVVKRSFLDRSTDTRKMAAQIIGNMYSLTDEKDLKPYLGDIIPGLKNTLLDPVPEVRTIAAKALGAMVKGSGESQFEELLPWLMENLTSEQSSVDRSGAAQGLSEVLASLGTEKLAKLMSEVIKTANSDDIPPHIRDGYVMLFVYLPLTFGDEFVGYIGDVVQPILKALADENEYVRATALCAGQRIISTFAETAIPVLLPQLEKGLFGENWRIRLSSIQLLGDLLYHISGVTGKMSATGGEDDNFGTAEGFKALIERLGQERRDLVLSGLYMGRSDVALQVRQSALHVWKIIVPNTPRILREILPTLFKLLLGCLASQNYDKRQVAARTLGDIVRKLGERMLPELIPILERGLDSEEASQRQGVCIGLTEIIKSCSKDAILVFTDNLVPTVRKALCDPLPEVRMAASTTFEYLHSTIGVQALDEILPSLLRNLKEEDTSEHAVDGLRQIIAVKGRVVLPFIVPKLIEPPVNTKVLGFLSAVAGEALTRHLGTILKALFSALIEVDETDSFDEVLEDAEKVVLSVEGEHGMRIIIDDLLQGIKSQDPQNRYVCVVLLHAFCKNTEEDFSDYISVFMQSFIKLLADSQERVQAKAWDTLAVITSSLDPSNMQKHISSVRHALRYIKNDEVVLKTGVLPGFCLPKKGMSPLLPVFREGILNGGPDVKEQAAKGIGECIQFLTPVALKPSVVSITGPLIRILGDRFNWNVKLAVLETLSALLEKVGLFLKPFLPQLQTTFSKALLDPNRSVRLQSGIALSNLCTIHTRIDPLFLELSNNISSVEDVSVKETLLQALRACIRNGGKKLSDKIKSDLIEKLSLELSSDEDKARSSAAACLATLIGFIDQQQVTDLIENQMFAKETGSSWSLRQGRSSLLSVALKESCSCVLTNQYESRILNHVLTYAGTDRLQIVSDGIHSAAYLLYHYSNTSQMIPSQVTDALKKGFEHSSNDIRIEASRSINWCMQQLSALTIDREVNEAERTVPHKATAALTSRLISLTREKNTGVRSAAEYAIVALLKLRETEQVMQNCVAMLDGREVSILQELRKQRFKKIISTSDIKEDIDNTSIKS